MKVRSFRAIGIGASALWALVCVCVAGLAGSTVVEEMQKVIPADGYRSDKFGAAL